MWYLIYEINQILSKFYVFLMMFSVEKKGGGNLAVIHFKRITDYSNFCYVHFDIYEGI